jgi:Family of unknown function (DUF6350)
VIASFLIAVLAGGLGAARALAPWSRLAGLMPARSRSIVLGMLGSAAILVAGGAALVGGSLAVHLPEVRAATDALSPGLTGAALLLLAQLAYAPNAIIWAVAYMVGPGFAVGAGTVVAPTGSALGPVPAFPMLAALPSDPRPGAAGWVPVLALAVPYLAGVFGGIVTIRIAPTPTMEAAPLWGFMTGLAAGGLAGLAAAFAGGPLGDGRLAAVGPSGWQVGLVAILEIGVTAALAAAAANWLILRRATRRSKGKPAASAEPEGPEKPAEPEESAESGESAEPEAYATVAPSRDQAVPGGLGVRPAGATPPGVVDETDDADGHRIYLDPWAAHDTDDQLPALLQDADLAADRVGELAVARLLGGHRIRAVHAVVVRAQLRPEHRQYQQPQRTERDAEPAQHDPADRPARPRRAAPPRPAARSDTEPDRRRGEQQGKNGHVQPAAQVAEPECQAQQAQQAQRDRGQGALAQGGVRRRQLPARQHPPGRRSAPAGRLVSGHRNLFCPLR